MLNPGELILKKIEAGKQKSCTLAFLEHTQPYKENIDFKALQDVPKKLETGATSTTDQLRSAQSGVWKLLPTISFVPLQEQFNCLKIIGI